jgi:hypothetical protein
MMKVPTSIVPGYKYYLFPPPMWTEVSSQTNGWRERWNSIQTTEYRGPTTGRSIVISHRIRRRMLIHEIKIPIQSPFSMWNKQKSIMKGAETQQAVSNVKRTINRHHGSYCYLFIVTATAIVIRRTAACTMPLHLLQCNTNHKHI